MTEASIDIFIRSYYRDFRWLALSLRSIALFASGYREVVVVLPRSTLHRTGPPPLPAGQNVRVAACEDFRDDYLGQQITKLHADEYSDADLIVHLDSDNVFLAPCDLRQRFVPGGTCRISFDPSDARPVNDGFRQCPDIFFGVRVPWDLSGAPPVAVPRHLYAALRDHCRRTHGLTIDEYAHAVGSDRFCEFGLVRALAWMTEPSLYEWVDVTDPLVPECQVFWSRATDPADIVAMLPAALRDGGSG